MPNGGPQYGTAYVKVLPDLTEFNDLVKQAADVGLTLTETQTFEYDGDGLVTRTVRTVTITAKD